MNAIRYDDGLIAASGIEKSKFPDLVRCTDVIGTLLPEVANQLGLLLKPPSSLARSITRRSYRRRSL